MGTYIVNLVLTSFESVEVEAENKSEAEEMAREKFDSYDSVEVTEVTEA